MDNKSQEENLGLISDSHWCFKISKLIVFFTLIFIILSSKFALAKNLREDQPPLYRGMSIEPESLDPQKIYTIETSNIIHDLFEGLVRIDKNNNIEPAQAISWSSSNDGKSWIFHLRHSTWTNGVPVTAEDFIFAWRRAIAPETISHNASNFILLGIKNASAIVAGELAPDYLGVKALDSYTLEVTLEQQSPWILPLLTNPVFFPLPKKVILLHQEKWTQPKNIISNGPYQLKAWVVNEKVVLEANVAHPEYESLKISKVIYLPLSSKLAELYRYKNGSLHITSGIPPGHYEQLKGAQQAALKSEMILGIEHYTFNTSRPPFDNSKIRKALSYAVDRDILVQQVLREGHRPAYTFTPAHLNAMPNHVPEYSFLTQEKRNEQAKKLYQEAGYSAEKPLKFTMLYNNSDLRHKIALAVVNMWQQTLGVSVKLKEVDFKSLLDLVQKGNFQLARSSWIADFYDPAAMLMIFMANNKNNKANYQNENYDSLMENLIKKPSTRYVLYEKMEAILADDMPVIPLYYYNFQHLVSPSVGGYYSNYQGITHTRYLSFLK